MACTARSARSPATAAESGSHNNARRPLQTTQSPDPPAAAPQNTKARDPRTISSQTRFRSSLRPARISLDEQNKRPASAGTAEKRSIAPIQNSPATKSIRRTPEARYSQTAPGSCATSTTPPLPEKPNCRPAKSAWPAAPEVPPAAPGEASSAASARCTCPVASLAPRNSSAAQTTSNHKTSAAVAPAGQAPPPYSNSENPSPAPSIPCKKKSPEKSRTSAAPPFAAAGEIARPHTKKTSTNPKPSGRPCPAFRLPDLPPSPSNKLSPASAYHPRVWNCRRSVQIHTLQNKRTQSNRVLFANCNLAKSRQPARYLLLIVVHRRHKSWQPLPLRRPLHLQPHQILALRPRLPQHHKRAQRLVVHPGHQKRVPGLLFLPKLPNLNFPCAHIPPLTLCTPPPTVN